MNKELKALERILHKIPASQQGQDELIIIQALTSPTAIEIVKELQSWFLGRRFLYFGSNPVTKYFESTDEEVCIIFRKGIVIVEYDTKNEPFEISCDTLDKITSFFMSLEDNNEKV